MADPSQLTTEQLLQIAGVNQAPARPRTSAPRNNQPRGIRNNNPGNIEDGSFARSLPGYAGSDGRFAIFNSPDAGNAAKSRLLGSYIQRGFDTPASIINRWAPPSDNNPTSQYADYVARRAGVGVNDRVTADQIPLIAQAISEFENGNTVPVGGDFQFASAPQDLTTVSEDELLAAAGLSSRTQSGNPIAGIQSALDRPWLQREPERVIPVGPQEYDEEGRPVVSITGGVVRNRDGSYSIPEQLPDGSTALYRVSANEYRQWRGNSDDEIQVRRERAERESDPAYQARYAEARGRAENIPDWLLSLTGGATLGGSGLVDEILGGVDYLASGFDPLASQAARDAVRDEQEQFATENPLANFGLQLGGGLITPGLAAGGNWIAGAQGAERLRRAGVLGAATGAGSGFVNAEGNVLERAPDAVAGAGVGAGVGVVGQAGFDRIGRALASAPARPVSAARRLSREGVELTPGQMVSEVPIVGTALRNIEEGASTIPLAGAAIAGARNRSLETFNRAAINRALAPINETLPTNLRGVSRPQYAEAGYEAVENAQQAIGRAYDRALEGVTVRADQQFYDDLAQVAVRAAEEMPPDRVQQLLQVINNRAFRNMEFRDSPISGQQFKMADSELASIAREYRTANDPAMTAFARNVEDVRSSLRSLVSRQRPDRADQINAADRAYANLVKVEDAAGSSASMASEGVFSPTQLGMASLRSQSRSSRARQGGLMQDLATDGRAILNSRIGDSGTATRGAVTALASGAAGAGAIVNPAVAVPVIAGVSAVYSRPAQAALNAIYRASDSQSAMQGLRELVRLAQRDPALLPYYEGALQHVLGREPQGTPAGQPANTMLQPTTSAR